VELGLVDVGSPVETEHELDHVARIPSGLGY
jgi:hypothetical protein